jgi:Putative zinc-finger
MSCLLIRELLPEHAMGVLPRDDAGSVDAHLAWCAACRKEAGELQRAAATLAFSVAPVEPPSELEDRVVEAVREVAARRSAPRRRRGVAAALLAAVLALTGLGWGAVMAGRNARLNEEVAIAQQKQQEALRRLGGMVEEFEELTEPGTLVELADLMSPRQAIGGGDALVLLSPASSDVALVAFTGLTGVPERRMPIEVWLESDEAADILVGRIDSLNTDGGGGVRRWYLQSLRPYDAIVVRDARGRVLLNGTLTVYEPTP